MQRVLFGIQHLAASQQHKCPLRPVCTVQAIRYLRYSRYDRRFAYIYPLLITGFAARAVIRGVWFQQSSHACAGLTVLLTV